MDENNLLKIFGFNVKVERMRQGLTQAKFAEMLNIHEKHIYKIESGKQNVTLKTIGRIANVLKVKESLLLEEKL